MCGGHHGNTDNGCGLYFCNNHANNTMFYVGEEPRDALCDQCIQGDRPFTPKEDVSDWLEFKKRPVQAGITIMPNLVIE